MAGYFTPGGRVEEPHSLLSLHLVAQHLHECAHVCMGVRVCVCVCTSALEQLGYMGPVCVCVCVCVCVICGRAGACVCVCVCVCT